MANKQSVNWLSGQRVDIPDLRSIESGVIFDFKSLLQCFVGNNPYILRGFTIPVSGISGPATSLQLVVDSAVVWIPGDSDGSFLRVESGTPNEVLSTSNAKVVGSFSPGSNYVGIQFSRATDPTTADLVSIWDVDSQTEFTVTAPRGVVLDYQIVIDGTSFGNTSPIAIVTVSGSNVTSIENAKTSPFRLGRGGSSPDITYNHAYAVNPENPLIATSNVSPDPFTGGDWELDDFKEWMDAVMTEIKTIKGSAFWYSAGGSTPGGLSLTDVWFDALGSLLTGRGKFIHSLVTPGNFTWTSNLFIKAIIGPIQLTIAPGSLTLADGENAYVQIIRDQDFQPANVFTFTNGSPTITAAIPITGIVAGDYIKLITDGMKHWGKVLSVVGTTITLTSNYLGTTAVGKALRTQGSYTMAQATPAAIPDNADVYWIARRDDNAVPSATITAATRVNDVTTFTTSAPHSFVLGQTVVVSGMTPSSFNGVFDITAIGGSTFQVQDPGVDASASAFGTAVSAAVIYLKYFGELFQGESRQISDNVTLQTLTYIGATSETDDTPDYESTHYITQGKSLTKTIGQLDAALFANAGENNQDRSSKLIEGGTWSYSESTSPGAYTDVANTGGDTGNGSGIINGTNLWYAQSFTPSVSGNIGKVQLSLAKTGTPTGLAHAHIYSDSAGAPGSVLASSVGFNVATLTGTTTLYDFLMTSYPMLNNGTTYWIVFECVGTTAAPGNTVVIRQSNLNPYPSGAAFVSSNSGGSWGAVGAGYDHIFHAFTTVVTTSAVLNWSEDAYIDIPGVTRVSNTILAGNINFPNANSVAYVEINRTTLGPTNLTVNVADVDALVPTVNTVIIARKVSDGVLVGQHSFLLKVGEYLELDGALAEINRLLGQLRLTAHETDADKARISAADVLLLNGNTLSQVMGNLILSFDGAVVDFTTGIIYEEDGSTPLGVNFTPFAIPASQYFWYGFSLIPNATLADNRISAQVQVDIGASANASTSAAPKPDLTGDIKLGAVQVFNNAGSIEVFDIRRLGVGSGSGSGSGTVKANYVNPISTTLPTGASVIIDGIAGVNGDLVLFTNLASNNNRIYELDGVGTSITWTAVRAFRSQFDPTDGDSVRILSGNAFHDQLGVFNGTNFLFNDFIRLFDGVSGNFYEISSIKSVAIANNTTATIFSVTASGTENLIVSYSLVRGTAKETGQLYITHDGTNARVAQGNSYINTSNVSFTASISGPNLLLQYTSDITGGTGSMKYFVARWSDAPGGPTGIPSYSPGPGSTPAGGANMDIQYNSTGVLAGDSRHQWNASLGAMTLGAAELHALSAPISLLDNQAAPVVFLTYNAAAYKHVFISYSIDRTSANSRTGFMKIANNGTVVGLDDGFGEAGSCGITISGAVNAGNVELSYTSTNTGNAASFQYTVLRWT